VEINLHSPNTSSWRGGWLSTGTTLLLPFIIIIIIKIIIIIIINMLARFGCYLCSDHLFLFFQYFYFPVDGITQPVYVFGKGKGKGKVVPVL
jgi:hypothetical protein